MTQYFKKFPVINYANTSAVNLMARVNMTKLALGNKQAYYSYQIPDGMRSDNLSYNYYDNPDYVWLINLSNQITDPYYEYPLADSDVYTLIIQKYGSIANAQQIIDHFETNWATDSSNISVAAYNNLTAAQRKYWAPVVDNNNTIFEYVRKQEDWIVTTNEVQQLSLSYSAELITEDGYVLDTEDSYDLTCPEGANKIPFIAGELVQQNGYTIGTIAYASETVLNVQHISGQVVSPQTVTLVSTGSTGNVVSTSSNTVGIYVGMQVTSASGAIPLGAVVIAVNSTPGSNSFTLNVTPTVPDDRTNLVKYSEQFDNANWGKSNSTVTADVAVSPYNTTTADKINETAVTNFFAVSLNPTGAFSTTYTWSCFAKAAERSTLFVNFSVSGVIASFDLSSGSTTLNTGTATLTSQNVGNGWWRCSVTFITPGSGSNVLYHIIGPAINSSTQTYVGTAGYGIYVWGAQLETAMNPLITYPTAYIPTTAAAVTVSGSPPYSVVLGNTTFSTSVTGAAIGPIIGLSSGALGTITDVYTASQNIPATEAIYWSPVTAYDMIYKNNASNRNITILNNSFAQQATKELKKLMSV